MVSLLPIVAIFLIFWFLVIRPASRRQKELRQVQSSLTVGDEVITNSGVFGVIDSLDDTKVGLRIAPDVVITMARQAIAGIPPKYDEDESVSTDDIPNEEN